MEREAGKCSHYSRWPCTQWKIRIPFTSKGDGQRPKRSLPVSVTACNLILGCEGKSWWRASRHYFFILKKDTVVDREIYHINLPFEEGFTVSSTGSQPPSVSFFRRCLAPSHALPRAAQTREGRKAGTFQSNTKQLWYTILCSISSPLSGLNWSSTSSFTQFCFLPLPLIGAP